ncbi:unnamed protein product [Calypogeia fissa]
MRSKAAARVKLWVDPGCRLVGDAGRDWGSVGFAFSEKEFRPLGFSRRGSSPKDLGSVSSFCLRPVCLYLICGIGERDGDGLTKDRWRIDGFVGSESQMD